MRANIWFCLITLAALALFTACVTEDGWQREYSAGVAALSQHNFVHAERELKQACALAFNAHQNIRLADALTMLARVYSEQGKMSAAQPLYAHALNLYRGQLGPEHQRVAAALDELAVCLRQQGQLDQAEQLTEQALAINEKALGADSESVALTASNLAQIYQREGKDSQAEELLQKSLAIYQKQQQPKDLAAAKRVIASWNNLAVFYVKQAHYDAARENVEKALQLQRKMFGADSPGEGVELSTLAAIELANYNNDLAAEYYQDAIRLLQKSAREYEEVLCETNDLYADLLLNQKDYAAAESVYKTAIEHCQRAHGSAHPCVAERLDDLAQLYRRTGRYTEAEHALTRALEINKQSYDLDSGMVANSLNELSAVYVDQHKYAQAEDVYGNWVPTLTKVLGSDHPHVADALENWALVAKKANNQALARRLLGRAKAIRLKQSAEPKTL